MSLLDEVLAKYRGLPAEGQKALVEEAMAATAAMAWVPNPGAQTDAYLSEADELFYGGSAGGGKTDLLVGLAQKHHRSRIFRRHFKDVDGVGGVVPRLAEILGTWAGYHRQQHLWRLSGNREIEFGAFTNAQEAEAYQGRPTDFLAFDEITQFEETLYRFLQTWNRSTTPGVRSRCLVTGNPPVTAEGRWVIKYWAPWLDPTFPNPAKPGELRWVTTINGEDVWLDGPTPIMVDGELVKPRSRSFIPATLADNPDLAETDYASTLSALPEPYRSAFKSGNFNAAFDDHERQVIPTAWIFAAQQRWALRMEMGKPLGPMTSLGVDVAQGGKDNTVLSPLHKTTFAPLIKVKGIDTKNGAKVAALVVEHMTDDCSINVDCGGGWGNSTVEHLENNGFNVVACIGSKASQKRTRDGRLSFRNKRAEWWWTFREALDPETGDDVALPPDGQMVADLSAPRFKLVNREEIQIEEKAEIIKRLHRSPDDGDAVVNAWAEIDPTLRRERKSRQRKRSPQSAHSPGVQTGYAKQKAKFQRKQ